VIETHSETWRHVAEYAAARLEKIAAEVLKRGKSEMEYEHLRGQHKALCDLLAEVKRPDDRSQTPR